MKRILALLLCAVLLAGCVPSGVLERYGIIHFRDMDYVRPDMDAIEKVCDEAIALAQTSGDAEEVLDAVWRYYDAYDDYTTNYDLAYIRHHADMTDEFWTAEHDFCAENYSRIDMLLEELYTALAESPLCGELEEQYFGEGFLQSYLGEPFYDEALLDLYAREQELGMQLHLSTTAGEVDSCLDRTGLSPAELMNCHRLFNVPVTAAGCAALTEEDRAILGKKKATAVVTPCANAKNGMKPAPIASTVKAGINVALGTDGALEAGNLDLFEVMRAAAMSVRAAKNDPAALPASAALMMATVTGAQAQGRSAECGMLQVGMDADIVLVDFSAPHLMPCHNVVNSLVFSAKGGDVAMTMVRGKKLYVNGQFPTLDLGNAVRELMEYAMPKLFEEPRE